MPIGSSSQGYQKSPGQMTCIDKVKMGFGMGFCIGMATGVLLGGFQALRFGLKGRELRSSVGKAMLQAGGSFGVFMAVGTALRC